MLPSERVETMGGSFVVDGFAKFMKALTLIASAGGVILSLDYMRREGISRFEYPILIVLSTIGMMMVISANDLIALYLGLELLSLSSYVIAAFDRDNVRSTEAGLKYFVLGALSSGMLLYGASLVYGFTGSVSFPTIAATLQGNAVGIGAIFGLVFVAAGIAFKISAVPFHMWTPDVYEGSPTPGDGVLRRRAQDGRHGDGDARLHRCLPGHPRCSGSRSSSSSRSPRWRSAPSPPSASATSSA